MTRAKPRAVKCVETGEIFTSSGAAGDAFDIDPSGILRCCKGQANSAAGHTWVFADEDTDQLKKPVDKVSESQVEDDEAEDQDEDDWEDGDDWDDDDDDESDDDDKDDYGPEDDGHIVADFMKTNVVTIKISDSLADAEHIMFEGGFNRLPVLDDENKLVGIVTRFDILKKKAEITEFTEAKFLEPSLSVEKFVKHDIVVAVPSEPAMNIRKAYIDYNVKFLPVIKSETDRTLIGVVTYYDYTC